MENKKIIKKINSFFKTIKFCFSLAWNTSKFYTVCRLIMRIIMPLCGIALSFVAKYITDVLADVGEVTEKQVCLIFLIGITFSLNIINALSNQLVTYSTKMHNDILEKDISLMIMNKSLDADMEMFDNPEYYNRFTIAQRDSQSISLILWNVVDLTSELITVVSVSFILSKVDFLYVILLILGTLPAAVATRFYIKDVYGVSVAQIDEERKKQYLSYIATEKMYAQNIRLYNLGHYIKKVIEVYGKTCTWLERK